MCGIVGLFLKNPELEPELGRLFAPMLATMCSRGPDSAGFAIYGGDLPKGRVKATVQHPDPDYDWTRLAERLGERLRSGVEVCRNSTHATLTLAGAPSEITGLLEEIAPEATLMSIGRRMQIMKETGTPQEVIGRFGVAEMAGSHAIGHTRMATESAVTTAGSHPFSTGADLCLVHNESLSNHNRLRRSLQRAGIAFKTDNDTEVAAGYVAWKLKTGSTLHEALTGALSDLDGFYTFAVGTIDGFAVLRDPIACKPAVLAENDDYVAMASEYRSLAALPGIADARIWEPEPATVYAWSRS